MHGELRVFVSTLGCDGGKSGISQYVIHLMKEFPKVVPDVRFDVLVLEGEEHLFITDPDRMSPVPVRASLKGAIKNLAWQQLALPRMCRKEKYDVVFFPAANRRLTYSMPCPSVGTFHDLAILHLRNKYDVLHSAYSLHVLPMMVRRLSTVITVSECSKRDLIEYVGVDERRVVVIPEGVDRNRYCLRDKDEARDFVFRQYNIQGPYLLYISRIEHPGKNHVRLIQAFEQLKRKHGIPHRLVLAGSDWLGADAVHRVATESSCARDIVFTGFVPDEHTASLYRGADAFVFPSLFEGFGLPLLEAMSSGIPVACSNSSSLPEVAGNAAVLFDPTDVGSIGDGVLRVLTDGDDVKVLVRNGLERCDAYSWSRAAEQTAAVLRHAAETRANC